MYLFLYFGGAASAAGRSEKFWKTQEKLVRVFGRLFFFSNFMGVDKNNMCRGNVYVLEQCKYVE